MQGSRYNIEALSRGLGILELFSAKNPSLTLTEVAALLSLSKSTVFRILSTLEAMGYLERDPASRRYRPSLKVLHLGFGAINRLEVRQVARQYLEQVAQELDETASLAVLYGTDIIYVDRIRNRAIVGVVLDIGSHVPAHCTTMGKVLLANLATHDLRAFLQMAELTRYTTRTLTDKGMLFKELEAIRKDGYSISDGELAIGLRAAGAPIRDHNGEVLAAIGISGPTSTISMQRLKKEIAPAVVRTAEQISLALGYIPIRTDKKVYHGAKGFS